MIIDSKVPGLSDRNKHVWEHHQGSSSKKSFDRYTLTEVVLIQLVTLEML